MTAYSEFFQTLHDEQSPTGYLGRGTHYSILRAVVFHDPMGRVLPEGQFCDFAVIWDEDHDNRVIEPIEMIYRSGLLSSFLFFGERKGGFTALLSDQMQGRERQLLLAQRIQAITQSLNDPWFSSVAYATSSDNDIISDSGDNVSIYLSNLKMLWRLGLKSATPPSRHVLPRVSAAAGGLMPGIDLNDSGALQEMDDRETVRRFK